MATVNMTDVWLKTIKPEDGKQLDFFDQGQTGLCLRVSYGGTKTWFAYYRIGRRLRKTKLGRYPALKLKQARKLAKAVRVKADNNEDVQANKTAERLAETFGDLATLYIEKHAKPHKRTWGADERLLQVDVLPHWKDRKAHDITRRDVVALIEAVADRGAPIQANRLLALIRKVFNFGISRDVVAANPCAQVKRPGKETRRDRVLTEDEIKTLLDKLSTARMAPAVRHIVQLQLMLALRPGEVANGRWEEFDLNTGWWTIPAERSKNGLAHRVPLPPQALALLQDIRKVSSDSEWLFPTAKRGSRKKLGGESIIGPVDPKAVAHSVHKNLEHFGLEHFTPHDLRRTAASLMTSMGVSRLVVRKLLNHAEPDVTAVYDRHSYDAEKRQALSKWNDELDRIAAGQGKAQTNVVDIDRARA